MLRRLEYCGWLEIETDKSYVQRVNFKEYAVRIVKTLLEIAKGKQIEYQGYIYTIYSLVWGNTDHPGVVLMQIMENTDLLITGLKNLNSNIKHYIDDLTRIHKTVAEIMGGIYRIDFLEELIRIYNVGCLDKESFYAPIEGRKEFKPQEIGDMEPDLKLRQEKLRKMAEKMQKIS